MSGLDTLVRLYAWNLEEARRALGMLNAVMAGLASERNRLERALEREADTADEAGSIEATRSYSAFLTGVRARQAEIDEDMRSLQEQVDQAETAVAEALRDSKACEAALDRIAAEKAVAERRRQQAVQDEAGRRLAAQGTIPQT